jgi:HSP20 family protein
MSLIKWRKPDELFPAFGNMVNEFFRDDDFFDGRFRMMRAPAVNVQETNDAFKLEVAAPGMKKSDFKVEVENGYLVISAETKAEKEETAENYTRKEFSFNAFKRTFWLPDGIKEDKINATYKDGMLYVTLPKTEVKKVEAKKKIAIS